MILEGIKLLFIPWIVWNLLCLIMGTSTPLIAGKDGDFRGSLLLNLMTEDYRPGELCIVRLAKQRFFAKHDDIEIDLHVIYDFKVFKVTSVDGTGVFAEERDTMIHVGKEYLSGKVIMIIPFAGYPSIINSEYPHLVFAALIFVFSFLAWYWK
jgi:hypothetical protein